MFWGSNCSGSGGASISASWRSKACTTASSSYLGSFFGWGYWFIEGGFEWWWCRRRTSVPQKGSDNALVFVPGVAFDFSGRGRWLRVVVGSREGRRAGGWMARTCSRRGARRRGAARSCHPSPEEGTTSTGENEQIEPHGVGCHTCKLWDATLGAGGRTQALCRAPGARCMLGLLAGRHMILVGKRVGVWLGRANEEYPTLALTFRDGTPSSVSSASSWPYLAAAMSGVRPAASAALTSAVVAAASALSASASAAVWPSSAPGGTREHRHVEDGLVGRACWRHTRRPTCRGCATDGARALHASR